MALAAEALGVDRPSFTQAMAELPAGIAVATCLDGAGSPLGATLSSVASLSLDPPMLLACLDRRSNTLRRLAPGAPFLLHVLAEGQETAAMAFAGKAENKFAAVAWARDREGLPRLDGCAVVIDCRVAEVLPGGDHMIVTGLVTAAQVDGARRPLLYHRRRISAVPRQEETTP